MNRRTFNLSALGAAAMTLSGCGGGDEPASEELGLAPTPSPAPAPAPSDPPGNPELATLTSLPVGTVFLQTLLADDGRYVVPGQSNYWDIRNDFRMADGGADQWDGALLLSVASAQGVVTEFPRDHAYADLSAYGPELGAADGVKTVTFQGNEAVLHPVKGVRLQQTLDLTTARTPVLLVWEQDVDVGNGWFDDEPFAFQVVIRDAAGALLGTLYRDARDGQFGTQGAANLDNYVGQSIVLSFELESSTGVGAVISAVSVADGTSSEYVSNGDFNGSDGWVVPDLKVSQNILSAVRTVGDVQVRRMFYTQPDVLWGRFADTFSNPGASPVSISVEYRSELGSDGEGIIYDTPGANGRAITTWDGSGLDRDTALVFGGGGNVAFTSATAVNTRDGREIITTTFSLTIPAGATRTLIHFILLNGVTTATTATTATDVDARSTQLDLAAADIANNFRSKVAFQRGLMREHIDTVVNF